MNLHPAIAVVLVALAILLQLAGMRLIRHFGERYGWSAELQRKTVHVATGLFAMALPWLLPQAWLVYSLLALAMVMMAIMRLPSVATAGIGAALHGVERKSWGDFLLVAAVATLYFYSDQAKVPVLYVLPLAVLTVSDAAAAVAGSSYGRMRYAVADGHKSIEGSAVFFMVTLTLAMIALLLLSEVPRDKVVLLSLMTAAFATIIEADSWRGLDNYLVPVCVMFLISVHMYSGTVSLVLLTVAFLALLGLLITYGGALLGLTDHAARTYTAALFMIGTITTPPNMILPASTLVVQTYARRLNPSSAHHPDLDTLSMLAVISFVALIGGDALGYTAISFYAIAFAAVVVQFGLLAFAQRPLLLRLALAVTLCALVAAVVLWVISLNPQTARWHGPILPLIGLSLVAPAALSAFQPGFYHDYRYVKVGAAAALIPSAGYLYVYAYLPGGIQ